MTCNGTGITPPLPAPAQAPKRQFYATVELDPKLAKKQFADIVEEVVTQFTTRHGVRVKISIEIEAETDADFDSHLQRVVTENCKVLKFKNVEFE